MLRRLDQADLAVAELALRRSSLDEVFLVLTGHRAEPEAAGREGEGPQERGEESERTGRPA